MTNTISAHFIQCSNRLRSVVILVVYVIIHVCIWLAIVLVTDVSWEICGYMRYEQFCILPTKPVNIKLFKHKLNKHRLNKHKLNELKFNKIYYMQQIVFKSKLLTVLGIIKWRYFIKKIKFKMIKTLVNYLTILKV